mgnify:CR=1 FL=1
MTEQTALRRRGRPPGVTTAHRDTRTALIWHGTAVLTEQGFAGTGIEPLLSQVGVPKGSFYHYFPSKEAFGYAVLDHYAAYFARKLERWLEDEHRPPLERLAAFIADASAGMARHDFRRGCLVGNLGQELGAAHDGFRERLEAILGDWQDRVRRCLEAARARGDLAPAADCRAWAEFFWIGWEGAVLRAKLTRCGAPLERFAELFFAGLPR